MNRPYAVDIFQVEYEYCTISKRVEASRNSIGEANYTLESVSTNVKCVIEPLSRIPSYVGQYGLGSILKQGISEGRSYLLILSSCQAIEPGHAITDYNGIVYDVLYIVNWYTHKEALLSKRYQDATNP